MFSKQIYIRIILQVIAIVAVAGTGAGLILTQKAIIIGVFCLAGAFLLIGGLVAYLNRFNRRILRFLEAMQDDDSMSSFPEHSGSTEQQLLSATFNQINERITRNKLESRQQEFYYKALLEQIPDGIISWDESGRIQTINPAASRLLNRDYIRYKDQLEQMWPNLAQIIDNASLNGNTLMKINHGEQVRQLAVSYKRITQNGETLFILTLKDIARELSEKETESWDKLTHILTHEIMNSIAPIVSLSGTILSYFEQKGVAKPREEITDLILGKTIRGLSTVKNQGQSLMRFTDSYRRLSYLQAPVIKPFPIGRLTENLQLLLQSDLARQGIDLSVALSSPDLVLEADEEMLSQVLINLLRNAMQALEETTGGIIRMEASQAGEKIQIDIRDNGPGIPKELLDDIFVPFFTTKSSGSGIGLSLSRQIIRMHGGELSVTSEPFRETCFRIVLYPLETTIRQDKG